MMDRHRLEEALHAVGELLADRNEPFDVVAIGGGGLLLLGILQRPTIDLDLVAIAADGALVTAEPMPPPLLTAAREVGALLKLPDRWLNGQPTSLLRFGLPPGFLERTTRREFGALTVLLASRYDQICFKLYAAADDSPHGKHLADLRLLAPSPAELQTARDWVLTHDSSDGFRPILDEVVAALGGSDA
jgi:hypothetical protein